MDGHAVLCPVVEKDVAALDGNVRLLERGQSFMAVSFVVDLISDPHVGLHHGEQGDGMDAAFAPKVLQDVPLEPGIIAGELVDDMRLVRLGPADLVKGVEITEPRGIFKHYVPMRVCIFVVKAEVFGENGKTRVQPLSVRQSQDAPTEGSPIGRKLALEKSSVLGIDEQIEPAVQFVKMDRVRGVGEIDLFFAPPGRGHRHRPEVFRSDPDCSDGNRLIRRVHGISPFPAIHMAISGCTAWTFSVHI